MAKTWKDDDINLDLTIELELDFNIDLDIDIDIELGFHLGIDIGLDIDIPTVFDIELHLGPAERMPQPELRPLRNPAVQLFDHFGQMQPQERLET